MERIKCQTPEYFLGGETKGPSLQTLAPIDIPIIFASFSIQMFVGIFLAIQLSEMRDA